MQLFGVIIAMLPAQLLQITDPLDWIFVYHFAGMGFFMLGYLLPVIKKDNNLNYQYFLVVTRSYVLLALGLCVFSTIVSYLQVTSVFSFSEYLQYFLSGNSQTREVRGTGNSEDGGLSGILKMFSYAPLGIYLSTLAWKHFYLPKQNLTDVDRVNKRRLNTVLIFSAIFTMLKVVMWLDRLTVMAMLIANLYVFINTKKSKKTYIFYSVLLVIVIAFANAVSSNRIEGYGLYDFVVLYFKLGLVNFDLMVKTVKEHTYGIRSFFSPVWFVLKYFGIKIQINNTYQVKWDDAQYMNSYLHQDFGYFSLFVYAMIGWFMRNADYFAHKGNRVYVGIYMMILFDLATFWVIPVSNSVNFYLMIVIAMITGKMCVQKVRIKNQFLVA